MAICVFWLLTYVGLGLALALGNRPVSNAQGTAHRQDYRRGNNARKMGELNSVDSNLLHLRAYPYEDSHRDHLSDWVVLNDEPTSASSSQFLTNVLIDGLSNDPRALQTLFFALSPTTILDVMYPDYTLGGQTAEPFLYDEASSLIEQHHRLRKHQRLNYKPSRRVIDLPILVYESADKASSESRQSNFDDLFEQRLTTATTLKTDLIFERTDSSSRELQNNNGLVSKPLVYEMNKIPGKRNQMSVGRRSIESEGTSPTHQGQTSTGTSSSSSSSSSSSGGGSIASQFMMRSVRGNKQYDVPQIECPASDDGMERFACPTADRMGRYRCIDDHVLCDGFIDCPTGEDEDRHACMFYKTTKAHLDVLADALLRWARGR